MVLSQRSRLAYGSGRESRGQCQANSSNDRRTTRRRPITNRAFRDIRPVDPGERDHHRARAPTRWDIGRTQMPNRNARASVSMPVVTAPWRYRHGLRAGRPRPCIRDRPDCFRFPVDSAIGFSGMEMETGVSLPRCRVKIIVLNNGGIGGGVEALPDNPLEALPTAT